MQCAENLRNLKPSMLIKKVHDCLFIKLNKREATIVGNTAGSSWMKSVHAGKNDDLHTNGKRATTSKIIFRCVHVSLYEGLSVHPSVRLSVRHDALHLKFLLES